MDELLSKLSFWDNLSEDERAEVRQAAYVNKYEAHELIHKCNKECLGMIYVLKGDLRLFLLSEEGKELTLLHIEEGRSCVLAASCVMRQITFHSELVASQPSELLIIPASVFSKLMKTNIYVRCNMYETSTKLFSDVMWVIQQTLFFSVDKRLASFLADEYDKTGCMELSVTQETIATEINTAREVVARMLKKFAADGIVQNRRGKIILVDIDALYDIAE